MSLVLSMIGWLLLLGAFVSLAWLVRRIIDRDRLVSEVEAYGRPIEDEGLPDLKTPVFAILGLLGGAVLADFIF